MFGARAAAASQVKALRVWGGPDSTRVVLDLSAAPSDYKLVQLDHPDRVVLDVEDSGFAGGFHVPSVKGLLKSIRSGQSGDAARVVLDLSGEAHPKSFLLKPAGQYGYRLVVDLYPPHAPKPQMARTIENDIAQGKPRPVVIAVDAGHGGEDPGAHGPDGTLEKNVTLSVARDLADLINTQPGMRAVLTRTGDYFVPLKRRYEIARQNKADLFVSIHADAYTSSDARGSSVWVLSPRGKTSVAARWLADRENSADLVGGVSLDDKDDTLASVLLDLSQGASIEASQAVAQRVLKALSQLGPTHRGYVEQANFVVLRSPDVPSILVETAFITNPTEEQKLRNPDHRQQLAQAVLSGVRSYFESTPPPGTWFAAVRSGRIHPGETDATALIASADDSKSDDSGSQDDPAPLPRGTDAEASDGPVATIAPPLKRTRNTRVAARTSGPHVRPPASDAYIQVVSDVPPPPVLPSAQTDTRDKGTTLDANIRDMHRVLRGETLSGIAQQYGVSLNALRSLNHKIPEDGNVQAGQVLLIPSS
ncbi:MAG TPA: N-acetylmuramoyl-L-alanine amidase [Rhodanobacteraceae bacterium]|nr:N-acetylmuramoyl-L-alanine amidase [Rhodanobacteraceae bacterium]